MEVADVTAKDNENTLVQLQLYNNSVLIQFNSNGAQSDAKLS